ncbi:MAG: DUF2461 domain-containing protein [Bacteroidales bacterium]|nr:DUF2461 domain-containing protein [Bacteroidales bacterium]MCM1147812.1 DUF2461 domain-containing protein [Bacteroidales bacterium]MCM1206460.1 DUF2461 domain-containing protein [Bacillota bacterium]MCM1510345.1 DUF2461 domain-containing protein [Clostridium sp.]
MKEILDFFLTLAQNNDKAWFDAHKSEYKAVKEKSDAMALEFMRGIEEFDPRVRGLGIKDITYRIHRDLRFTHDKRPYKTWNGVYVCPNGKKSGMAGYYIHLEPATNTYFLCSGLYNPEKEVVKSIREEIMCDGDKLMAALAQCEDFRLPWDAALKKIPAGFSASDKYSDYYRLKSFEIYKPLTKRDVLKKDFLKNALADLRRTCDYNEILNRCHDYAKD